MRGGVGVWEGERPGFGGLPSRNITARGFGWVAWAGGGSVGLENVPLDLVTNGKTRLRSMRRGERVTRPDGTRSKTMRGVFNSRVRQKRPEFCN